MAQISFMWYTAIQPRVAIALIFFALIILVLFSDEIERKHKVPLFFIFTFSVVVSHYLTTYIFLFLISLCWLFSFILNRSSYRSRRMIITGNMVLLAIVFSFFWLGLVTYTPLHSHLTLFQDFLGRCFHQELNAQVFSPPG